MKLKLFFKQLFCNHDYKIVDMGYEFSMTYREPFYVGIKCGKIK